MVSADGVLWRGKFAGSLAARLASMCTRAGMWVLWRCCAILPGVVLAAAGAPAAPDRWSALGEPVFKSYSDRLVANTVSFAQDKNGFVWMGTRTGLVRWDGYKFKRYVARADGRGGRHAVVSRQRRAHLDRHRDAWRLRGRPRCRCRRAGDRKRAGAGAGAAACHVHRRGRARPGLARHRGGRVDGRCAHRRHAARPSPHRCTGQPGGRRRRGAVPRAQWADPGGGHARAQPA